MKNVIVCVCMTKVCKSEKSEKTTQDGFFPDGENFPVDP